MIIFGIYRLLSPPSGMFLAVDVTVSLAYLEK